MSEAMPLQRFEALANAYGGVVARWPAHERKAAMTLAAQPAAVVILARASALDDALDAWTVPAPAAVLHARVAASVPAASRRPLARVQLWWSGIGIAAALGGAVAGTAAVAMVAPVDATSDGGTSFGDVGPQEG